MRERDIHEGDYLQGAQVERHERERQIRQRGKVLWFTGLSGAGKSTLSCAVERELHQRGFLTMRLDGDVVRGGLNRDLGFKEADRTENIRRFAEVARLFAHTGVIVLVATISPNSEARQLARSCIGSDDLLHFHVDTPLSICEARDPKGLYRKARAGEIPLFTGISAPYARPDDADVQVSTSESLEASVREVLAALERADVLSREFET